MAEGSPQTCAGPRLDPEMKRSNNSHESLPQKETLGLGKKRRDDVSNQDRFARTSWPIPMLMGNPRGRVILADCIKVKARHLQGVTQLQGLRNRITLDAPRCHSSLAFAPSVACLGWSI